MDGKIYYFCVEGSEGDLVGICIVNHIEIKRLSGEIGFQLNNKFWGKGYGKEMAQAILDICLKDIGLQTIIAKVNIENEVSINILKQINMTRIEKNETQWIYEYNS